MAETTYGEFKPKTIDEAIDEVMLDLSVQLTEHNERVIGRMAQTNAEPFTLDDCDVDGDFLDENEEMYLFNATLRLKGEQDQDKPWCGDAITVKVNGQILYNGGEWELQTYEVEEIACNWPEIGQDEEIVQ